MPQRVDTSLFPAPPDASLVKDFPLKDYEGRWFISAGLNPLFDLFDCQAHFFASPSPGTLVAKINWRISKPDGT